MLICGALEKSMRCSGFEEIFVESEVCASGSIGKHYNRIHCVHKLVFRGNRSSTTTCFWVNTWVYIV